MQKLRPAFNHSQEQKRLTLSIQKAIGPPKKTNTVGTIRMTRLSLVTIFFLLILVNLRFRFLPRLQIETNVSKKAIKKVI